MIENAQLTMRRLWQQLTWTQRLTIFVLTAAVAAAVALLVMWANTPSYGVLFSGLSQQDAGTIVTQLQQSKVPYQLDNGGTTILVPQSMVDAQRLQLASAGMPTGGVVGFESFDKSSIFQGDQFTENVNYTRALEGELTRTIGQISGVLYDKVNIVLPQQSLFSNDQANPTASVLLKLATNGDLTSDQVTGIQHLVASAVQGMKPEDVTVVDGAGNILSDTGALGIGGASGVTAQMAQSRYARTLEAQLMAMLDSVVGPDNAVVRVNDAMDWTQREQTSNTYPVQAKNSPLSASHISVSTALGPGSTVGGVPGLASNVPNYGTTGITATAGTSQTQRTEDMNYALSNTVQHVIYPTGTLKSLSIAVLLNGVTNKQELATLKQAVANAAGLAQVRNASLSVSTVKFDNSAALLAAKLAAQAAQQAFILNIVRWAALIIVPLILLFLLRRLLVSSRLKQYDDADLPEVEVLENNAEAPLLAAPGEDMSLRERQHNMLKTSMTDLAREKPETVAGLIGRWIEEDR